MNRGLPLIPCALLLLACKGGEETDARDPDEVFSGGSATVFDVSRMAFAQACRAQRQSARTLLRGQLGLQSRLGHRARVGHPVRRLGPPVQRDQLFGLSFERRPGASPERDDEAFTSLLFRLSVPEPDARWASRATPTTAVSCKTTASPASLPRRALTSSTTSSRACLPMANLTHYARRPTASIAGLRSAGCERAGVAAGCAGGVWPRSARGDCRVDVDRSPTPTTVTATASRGASTTSGTSSSRRPRSGVLAGRPTSPASRSRLIAAF